jgi:hypothetical protein
MKPQTTLGLLILLAACDPGDVVLLAPDGSDTGAPTVSIRAVIDTSYASIAASLGWMEGVPGAQVRVHRMEDPYDGSYWTTAVADSTGAATFTDLLFGLYEVEVTRPLTPAETGQADNAMRLLAGGRRLNLPTPRVEDVTVGPDHQGALVFSESSSALPPIWETGSLEYPDAYYFEVYNNSDTTIYLDGKYWGFGWNFNRDYSFRPCTETGVVRNDSQGIWAERILRFPGEGSDYPLAPGDVALIAKSAIDHRAVHSGLYDLSHADFEWGGSRNADNPDVPNLEDIGLRPLPWSWGPGGGPRFLSRPVDLATLPRYVDPFSGNTWVRIPRAQVLDASVRTVDWTTQNYEATPACLEELHRSFERLPGPAWALGDFDEALSFQRRVLMVLPDGRKVLQDTETSMVDFVKAVWTPGWVPDSLL